MLYSKTSLVSKSKSSVSMSEEAVYITDGELVAGAMTPLLQDDAK